MYAVTTLLFFLSFFFFFNDTATTEIYTLSLHDALPIWPQDQRCQSTRQPCPLHGHIRLLRGMRLAHVAPGYAEYRLVPLLCRVRHTLAKSLRQDRSEEHTSELQSLTNLVCRLLLEKKKKETKQKSKKLNDMKKVIGKRYNKETGDREKKKIRKDEAYDKYRTHIGSRYRKL